MTRSTRSRDFSIAHLVLNQSKEEDQNENKEDEASAPVESVRSDSPSGPGEEKDEDHRQPPSDDSEENVSHPIASESDANFIEVLKREFDGYSSPDMEKIKKVSSQFRIEIEAIKVSEPVIIFIRKNRN